ncbi:hypothetical protein K501DRAFT_166315, partial [Backusella circina FSU 941]
NNAMFANIVRTDGYTIDFIFCGKKRAVKTTSELQLYGFTKEEVEEYYSPIYLEPGRKHVFTSVTRSDLRNNEVRKCSTKEYYTMTDSSKYQRSLDKEKINSNVKKMETDIPTEKTAIVTKYEEHIKYMLSNLASLFQFYVLNRAEARFHRFQGCQKARKEIVNILINGSKNYNKRRRRSKKLNRVKRKKKAKRKRR